MEDKIKYFAQNVLGCGCSGEVFRKIEVGRNVSLSGGIKLAGRINIGDRLLIYIVEGDGSFGEDMVRDIISRGIEDRDRNSFNRFRLAAFCSGDEAGLFSTVFDAHEGRDEKTHLHILKKGQNPFYVI